MQVLVARREQFIFILVHSPDIFDNLEKFVGGALEGVSVICILTRGRRLQGLLLLKFPVMRGRQVCRTNLVNIVNANLNHLLELLLEEWIGLVLWLVV